MRPKYDKLVLNSFYLLVSCIYTYSSWLYKGNPELQLLLQSLMKIISVSILCKMKTNSMPKIVLYDRYLLLSAVIYGFSSLCTSYIWLDAKTTPYTYSMGTKPSLFVSSVLQNGISLSINSIIPIFSLLGLLFVNEKAAPLFLLKCVLSSLGSYYSALGLGFGKDSSFGERCSKIISFSLISAMIPFISLKHFGAEQEFLEYVHAVLGATNGLCIAFVLSYNGALEKIALSSVKDIMFILHSADLDSFNVTSFAFQTGLAAWVSLKKKGRNNTQQNQLGQNELDQNKSESIEIPKNETDCLLELE